MSKKLDHIRGEVAGGGGGPGGPIQPPYNDKPIKQDIAILKQKDIQLEQRINQGDQKDNQLEQKINQVEQTHNVDKQNLESRIDNVSKKDNNFQVPQSGQTPTQNNHLATKQYVDNKVAQGGGGGGGQPFDPTPLQQEDLRLQGEIDKTNAKVTTVEQTANNAEQKATDNEQSITDLEQEDIDIKRRLTTLENAPPGGGGGQPFDPTPLHQEDQRLQGEIDKANQNITGLALSLRNVAMVDQPNRFLEEQILEKAQVRKVDMKNQHSILNLNTFISETNLMLVPLTRRVEKLEQRPPGGGGAPPYDDRPVWQKIGQIEADTQTALDTAVKTEQKFGNLENRVNTCAFVGARNVFTEENTFNNQIVANRVQVSFEGNADNDTVTRKMLKKYNTFQTNNNTTKTLDRYSFAGRDLRYYQYEGLLTFNNNKVRITSRIYRILNCQIWLSVGGVWYLCPFFNAQGRYSAYVALDQSGTGLEIHSSGLVGGFQSRVVLFFAEA